MLEACLDWMGEPFDPDRRAEVSARIANASATIDPGTTRAEADLHDAEMQIARLVDSVASGGLTHDEVAQRLSQLREKRDAAKALRCAAAPLRTKLGEDEVAALLNELGGRLGIGAQLTREETKGLFAAANLTVRYDYTTRRAQFRAGGGA
ncbi:MAG: hypothetical protein JWM85_3247 [Acidimicrobiaceae bacterium]|nr:hypothetical protein [Acidimicrobiaceae bacterium]